MKKLLILILLVAATSFGQKRILVSPYGDAIPIGKNQGAAEMLKRSMLKTSGTMVCTDKATFGFTAAQNPNPTTNHIGFHQDIMAMWYVAPAAGTIDSVFWWASDVGSLDSTITLRLFESNVYPGVGPGYGGYPASSQTTCWGYFINTNDHRRRRRRVPGGSHRPDLAFDGVRGHTLIHADGKRNLGIRRSARGRAGERR